MPHTFSQIILHVVFSTKDREPWITPDIRDRLHPYMCGIVKGEGGVPLAIGGMPDHVHLLATWRADRPLSDLMRQVKGGSSRWLHETIPSTGQCRWQGATRPSP